jgi:hypothetical protein
MNSAERPTYAINRTSCTEPVLEDILSVYCRTVLRTDNVKVITRTTPVSLIHELSVKESRNSDWRLGSYLTGHSKLWVRGTGYGSPDIFFYCSANLGNRNQVSENLLRKGKLMEEDFEQGVNDYLQQKGLGIPYRRLDGGILVPVK